MNAISLAAFRADVTLAVAQGATADLDEDLAQGRLRLAELLWRRALDAAAELGRRHTPTIGTRSLDVLHVASATVLGMSWLVTYDGRQANLARAVGLKVARP